MSTTKPDRVDNVSLPTKVTRGIKLEPGGTTKPTKPDHINAKFDAIFAMFQDIRIDIQTDR